MYYNSGRPPVFPLLNGKTSVSPVCGLGEVRLRMEDSDGKREITLRERLRSIVEVTVLRSATTRLDRQQDNVTCPDCPDDRLEDRVPQGKCDPS